MSKRAASQIDKAAALRERRGAARRADVSPALKLSLEQGRLEAKTLSEILVIDFAALLRSLSRKASTHFMAQAGASAGILQRIQLGAASLLEAEGKDIIPTLLAHTSDTLRGMAAYALAQRHHKITPLLRQLVPLASDHNPNVREWVWLAARPLFAQQLAEGLKTLQPYVKNPNANMRRFASELSRPRGVWCAHIAALKQRPQLGLPLLQPLLADDSRYVQNSVGNWLNDAAKTQPDFVRQLCQSWLKQSDHAATRYIVKRGQRSL